jgi:peptidoglycan/xylan/chitin deacetylase (PgdA/CDA1 family)
MTIGVHSHSHPILARLTPEEQRLELSTSKALVEEQLGVRADFVAYPDGASESYDEASKAAAAASGFRAAFSFCGGTNLFGGIDRFDVRRTTLHPYSDAERLRFSVDMLSLGVTRWL